MRAAMALVPGIVLLVLGWHGATTQAARVPSLSRGGAVTTFVSTTESNPKLRRIGDKEDRRKILQNVPSSPSGTFEIPASASRLVFTTYMAFDESLDQNANNTELLLQNYLQSVSTSLGVPLEDVFPLNTQITYFRLSNPTEVSTYLAEAEIETLVIYDDEATGEEAYTTIQQDPVAWGEETFTTATFPTLEDVEVFNVDFTPPARPPAPPPPAYPFGKWPLVFSTIMEYGDSGSVFAVRDARDAYVRILMEEIGLPIEDVVIRFIATVFAESESSNIIQQTFDTTLLFNTSTDAESWAVAINASSWSSQTFTGADFPGIQSSEVTNVELLSQVPGIVQPPAPPPTYGDSFAIEFGYILSLCICPSNPVTNETQLFITFQEYIADIFAVPIESVLLNLDVIWVDYADEVDGVVRTSRVISDADMMTAVLFETEAEARSAFNILIGGEWSTVIADGFGDAYVSSRVTSLRLVYPPDFEPEIVYPPGTYPVLYTSLFIIELDPSQTTLQQYLATFSERYLETVAAELGVPESNIVIRDIRVTELSYSPTSAVYSLEVDVMILFDSAEAQQQFYTLLVDREFHAKAFLEWTEVVEVRVGNELLVDIIMPPPPPLQPPAQPRPSPTPIVTPEPTGDAEQQGPDPTFIPEPRPTQPQWDPCLSLLEATIQISFDAPETPDVSSIPEQVDRVVQTCGEILADLLSSEGVGGSGNLFVVPGEQIERITEIVVEGSRTATVTSLARIECIAQATFENEETGQAALDIVNDPSWAGETFLNIDYGIAAEASRARVTSSNLVPIPDFCFETQTPSRTPSSCYDYYVITWVVKAMPYRPTIEKGDESSEGMRWPSDLEKEWERSTLPDLRAIIGWRMGVPSDSSLIQHNPDCDVEYRLEDLHEGDCPDQDGIKKLATFRSLFYDYNEALEFQDWVLYEDGLYPMSTMLTTNPYLCGAKVKDGGRVVITSYCDGEDGYGSDCGYAEGYTSPRETYQPEYSDTSPRETYQPEYSDTSPRETYQPEYSDTSPRETYQPEYSDTSPRESYQPEYSDTSPRETYQPEYSDTSPRETYQPEYYPPSDSEEYGPTGSPRESNSSPRESDESYDIGPYMKSSPENRNELGVGDYLDERGLSPEEVLRREVEPFLDNKEDAPVQRDEERFAQGEDDILTDEENKYVEDVLNEESQTGPQEEPLDFQGAEIVDDRKPTGAEYGDYETEELFVEDVGANEEEVNEEEQEPLNDGVVANDEDQPLADEYEEVDGVLLADEEDGFEDVPLDEEGGDNPIANEGNEGEGEPVADVDEEGKDQPLADEGDEDEPVAAAGEEGEDEPLADEDTDVEDGEREFELLVDQDEAKEGGKSVADQDSANDEEQVQVDDDEAVLDVSSRAGSFMADDLQKFVEETPLEPEPTEQDRPCRDVFKVYWELVMLPGSAAGHVPPDAESWPPASEAHFYITTDPAIKAIAAQQYADLGVDADFAEQIELQSIVHAPGDIDNSTCPAGLTKQVQYIFPFDTATAAARFRTWISDSGSAAFIEDLRAVDAAGFCDASGKAGMMQHEQLCG